MANSKTNAEIATQLGLMSKLLQISGADFFRYRAYQQAEDALLELTQSVADMVERGEDLEPLDGIGPAIAEKIEALVKTGKIPQLEELKKEYPPELVLLTRIANLGPKRVGKIFTQLGVISIADLKKSIETGKLAELDGFGDKLIAEIKADLDRANFEEQRVRWAEADSLAQPLLKFVRAIPTVTQVEMTGSYRRLKETVGDFDVVAAGQDGPTIINAFIAYPEIKKIISQGDTRSTVILKSGLQVDLRVVPASSFGAAVQYFTGSKAHGIGARKIAQSKGFKLNEYGLFDGEKQIAGESEVEIYHQLKLPFIPPELREDRGELSFSVDSDIPKLIELKDLRGDFQAHTISSDGVATLEEMAQAAKEQGLEYFAVTDHSKFIGITNGMAADELRAQIKKVRALNKTLSGIHILASVEVDILPDGNLALPDEVLAELDFVTAAIHSNFKLDRVTQTQRLVSAIQHPLVDNIAHPTGRIIGQRSGYQIDLEAVIKAAKKHQVALEINAHPSRLDLDDVAAKYAKEQGVKITLATDAHSPAGLSVLKYGVNQARRAWLEPEDVLNTYPLEKLKAYIQQKRKR